MRVNLSEKIEEIRRQPEYMRMKYVWICVAVSMFVILVLWFFSIASMFAEEKNSDSQATTESAPSIDEQLQTIKDQAPSLQDFNNQSLTVGNENTATANQITNDTQNSADGIHTPTEPQSSTYSSLSNTNSSQ